MKPGNLRRVSTEHKTERTLGSKDLPGSPAKLLLVPHPPRSCVQQLMLRPSERPQWHTGPSRGLPQGRGWRGAETCPAAGEHTQ